MGFGERLKAARKSRGYTQQQIADLMKIDKSTYCGYETGKRQPDVQKIKQLSEILGVSGDALLETGYEKAPAKNGERSVSDAKAAFLMATEMTSPKKKRMNSGKMPESMQSSKHSRKNNRKD